MNVTASLQVFICGTAVPQQSLGDTKKMLFKHTAALESRSETFYSDLREQLLAALGKRRRLLQQQELQIYCLDEMTGIDVLEAEPGTASDWLFEALTAHPGQHYISSGLYPLLHLPLIHNLLQLTKVY